MNLASENVNTVPTVKEVPRAAHLPTDSCSARRYAADKAAINNSLQHKTVTFSAHPKLAENVFDVRILKERTSCGSKAKGLSQKSKW